MLKYLEFQFVCDATFFLFLLSWPITRHFMYNVVAASLYLDAPRIFHRDNHHKPTYQAIPPADGGKWAEGFSWNPEEGFYMTPQVQVVFLTLLFVLQGILIAWFVMIVRLACRVIQGAHAEDDRSDDEGENEEEEVVKKTNGVQSDAINGNGLAKGKSTGTGNGVKANGVHKRK
jgi:very-long-chain ceramide synthase